MVVVEIEISVAGIECCPWSKGKKGEEIGDCIVVAVEDFSDLL